MVTFAKNFGKLAIIYQHPHYGIIGLVQHMNRRNIA